MAREHALFVCAKVPSDFISPDAVSGRYDWQLFLFYSDSLAMTDNFMQLVTKYWSHLNLTKVQEQAFLRPQHIVGSGCYFGPPFYQMNKKVEFGNNDGLKILKTLQKEECHQTHTMVAQNSNASVESRPETHLVQPDSRFVAARSLARVVLALSSKSNVINIWSLIV